MGNKAGTIKVAAGRLGLSVDEYLAQQAAGLKWCIRCKAWHSVSEFVSDRSRSDGLASACKASRNIRKTAGPGRQERQQRRAAGFRWCQDCGGWRPLSEMGSAYCRTHQSQRQRERYATDPQYRATVRQRVHARKRGVAPVPALAQELILDEFEGACAYCGQPATTWDHIVPISKGGETTPGNIVPACASCNSSKGDRDVDEWLTAKGLEPSYKFVDRLLLAYRGFYG